MATYTAPNAGNRPAVDSQTVGQVLAVTGVWDAAATNLVAADVVEMVKLPAGHVVVDTILDATSGTHDVGIAGGAQFQAASGAGIGRSDESGATKVAVSAAETMVTITNTITATTGTIALTVLYRAERFGE